MFSQSIFECFFGMFPKYFKLLCRCISFSIKFPIKSKEVTLASLKAHIIIILGLNANFHYLLLPNSQGGCNKSFLEGASSM